MARKASQANARRFYGLHTQQEVKHAWEALRRRPAYREALATLLDYCDAACPELAARIRRADFPSPVELGTILAKQPNETAAHELLNRVLAFRQTWHVWPLEATVGFEAILDHSGRGIPPALRGLMPARVNPDVVKCTTLDEATQSIARAGDVNPGTFAFLQSGEPRIEALRRSGWTPPEQISLTVDLRFSQADIMDRLQEAVEFVMQARRELLGVAISTQSGKLHSARRARQWRVWDHVKAGGSITDVAHQFHVSRESARRDFYLAEQDINGKRSTLRAARHVNKDNPKAHDFSEVLDHFKYHTACPAERNWETTDGLVRCPEVAALLGMKPIPRSDWTSSGRGRARLAEEGGMRRRPPSARS